MHHNVGGDLLGSISLKERVAVEWRRGDGLCVAWMSSWVTCEEGESDHRTVQHKYFENKMIMNMIMS